MARRDNSHTAYRIYFLTTKLEEKKIKSHKRLFNSLRWKSIELALQLVYGTFLYINMGLCLLYVK